MSDGSLFEPQAEKGRHASERNWLPLVIAAVVVLAAVGAFIVLGGHHKATAGTVAATSKPDPYAGNLPLTGIVMSESANLSGGKMTYLDGHIANHGDRTITGITVGVLFRSYTHEVAQNKSMQLTLIRTREPYIDTESVAAAPLKPGAEQDFRLIFDTVSPDWDGAYPEVRILRVDSK
jgi:hypothetical protein